MDNPYVILIAVVWCAAAIGSASSRSTEPFAAALVFSLLCGIGYLIYKLFTQ